MLQCVPATFQPFLHIFYAWGPDPRKHLRCCVHFLAHSPGPPRGPRRGCPPLSPPTVLIISTHQLHSLFQPRISSLSSGEALDITEMQRILDPTVISKPLLTSALNPVAHIRRRTHHRPFYCSNLDVFLTPVWNSAASLEVLPPKHPLTTYHCQH